MSRGNRGKQGKTTRQPSRPPVWMMLLVFLVAAGLYWNTLGHEFVFDDVTLISQNPLVSQQQFGEILSLHSYRPVRTLTYALNYWLGGEDPFGYHLFNLILHAANGILAFSLFWIWSRSTTVALAAALFFVSHPVQTAAVAYVSGRKDLLAGFFVLLGTILYTRYRQKGGRPTLLVASIVCFLLAILSKEVAIVFPAIILLVDAALNWETEESDRQRPGMTLARALCNSVRRARLLYGGFALVSAAALYYAVFVTEASRMQGYWGGSLANNLGTSCKLFAHYLKLVVFPYPLIADYTGQVFPVSSGLAEPATLISILIIGAYLGLTFCLFSRRAWESISLLWFLLLLLPVLHLVPFHELAADHFLYIPITGMAFLFGKGVAEVVRWREDRRVAVALVSLVVVVFGVLTVQRNQDWHDRQSLWQDTLEKAPASYRANSNLGQIYSSQGRIEEGIRLTRTALELEPDQAITWSNLGVMYFEKGKRQRLQGDPKGAEALQLRAIEALEKSIRLEPADAFAYTNLGNCYKELAWIWQERGNHSKAFESRRKAVEYYLKGLNSPDPRELKQAIWFSVAGVFIDAGYYRDAVYYLEKFLDAFPQHPRGLYWMGYSLIEEGKSNEALPYLEKAARLQPDLEVLGVLARTYEELHANGKAIETYQRALRVAPDSVEAHYNLGVLYHREGAAELAVQHLEQALRVQPQGPLTSNIQEMLAVVRAGESGSHRTQ